MPRARATSPNAAARSRESPVFLRAEAFAPAHFRYALRKSGYLVPADGA